MGAKDFRECNFPPDPTVVPPLFTICKDSLLTPAKLDLKFHIRVDFARLSVSSFRKRYAFQNGVVRVRGCDLSLNF